MYHYEKNELIESIKDFHMPRYNEIPDVGLYLEQTSKYITQVLSPIFDSAVTGSMISNYVKKGLVSNPVKKQYNREQIAYLLCIAIMKSALSMDNIKLAIDIQKESYAPINAYNYFAAELENLIFFVFGITDELKEIGIDSTDEKNMLRNIIIAVAHKIYLDKYFNLIQEKNLSKNKN